MTPSAVSGAALHAALRDALQHPASLVHPTYRHLERRVVLAGLTWAQWLALAAAGALAWLLAQVLPLPAPWNLSVGVLLPGIPAVALWARSIDREFDVLAVARGALIWRRWRGAYVPGGPTSSARRRVS